MRKGEWRKVNGKFRRISGVIHGSSENHENSERIRLTPEQRTLNAIGKFIGKPITKEELTQLVEQVKNEVPVMEPPDVVIPRIEETLNKTWNTFSLADKLSALASYFRQD